MDKKGQERTQGPMPSDSHIAVGEMAQGQELYYTMKLYNLTIDYLMITTPALTLASISCMWLGSMWDQ